MPSVIMSALSAWILLACNTWYAAEPLCSVTLAQTAAHIVASRCVTMFVRLCVQASHLYKLTCTHSVSHNTLQHSPETNLKHQSMMHCFLANQCAVSLQVCQRSGSGFHCPTRPCWATCNSHDLLSQPAAVRLEPTPCSWGRRGKEHFGSSWSNAPHLRCV